MLKRAIHQRSKHPVRVIVLAGLCVYGATDPYFIDNNEMVTAAVYCNKILAFAKREGNRIFDNRRYIFQQDGTPAHTSNRSQIWCKNNFYKFIPKQRWPSKSPDLKPLDYYFCDAVLTRMIFQNINSRETLIDEIKSAIKKIPI